MKNNLICTVDKLAKDYFKLPFEVFYRGPIETTGYEFRSDIEVNKFEDVKAVCFQQGEAWGVRFLCLENKGSELYACINGLHDEAIPEWLSFDSEEEADVKSTYNYSVEVVGQSILFTDEEVEDAEYMDNCCVYGFMQYTLDSVLPDYIILDADDTRVKVDVQGYILDEEGKRLGAERVFDPETLDEDDYSDYTIREMSEAKTQWVNAILKTQFPNEINLRLGYNTN